MRKVTSVFVPLVGQYDNIGDIILRRPLLEWISPHPDVHVFVGRAPDAYIAALGAGANVTFYQSFSRWILAGICRALVGRIAYIYKPGEIQSTWVGLKEHVAVLPLLLLIKMRRGPIYRIGAGVRGFEKIPKKIIELTLPLADGIYWRDLRTRDFFRAGDVIPDLGFSESLSGERMLVARSQVVVSMRSDRPPLTHESLKIIDRFSRQTQQTVVVCTQVARDSETSKNLARQMGWELLDWDGDDHLAQETQLRQLYRGASVVVSDRLHVLISAVSEGAAPCGLLTDDSDKIDRHFAAAGIVNIAHQMDELSIESLAALVDREPEFSGRLEDAREVLNSVRNELRVAIGLEEPRPTAVRREWTAYHVGRTGEVAGGMTQVLNAYALWKFPTFNIRVLQSRGGSTIVDRFKRFFNALWVVRDLPRDGSVVVVHLSQGGSFLREGLVLAVAARRLPVVAQLHGSSFVDFSRRNGWLVRWVLNKSTAVHCLSDSTRREVLRQKFRGPVRIIPNAVTPIVPAQKEQLVVFGGSVSKRKGAEELIAAWGLSELAGKGWRLVVAGPVTDAELPAALPLGVELIGSQPYTVVKELLARSSAAILPSHDEAMPMFILEAMSARNQIIASNVGAIPDLLADGRGVIVKPGDSVELAQAIANLEFDDLESEVGCRAQAYFQANYSPEIVMPQLEDLWILAAQARTNAAKLKRT